MRYWIDRIGDYAIRLGTYAIVLGAAFNAASVRDWSPSGLLVGGIILVVYLLFLRRCMFAEHVITQLEKNAGIKFVVPRWGVLGAQVDAAKFNKFCEPIIAQMKRQQADMEGLLRDKVLDDKEAA